MTYKEGVFGWVAWEYMYSEIHRYGIELLYSTNKPCLRASLLCGPIFVGIRIGKSSTKKDHVL